MTDQQSSLIYRLATPIEKELWARVYIECVKHLFSKVVCATKADEAVEEFRKRLL